MKKTTASKKTGPSKNKSKPKTTKNPSKSVGKKKHEKKTNTKTDEKKPTNDNNNNNNTENTDNEPKTTQAEPEENPLSNLDIESNSKKKEEGLLKCVMTLNNHKDWVNKIIELSNKQILSCSEDKTIKLWDLTELPKRPTPIEFLGHTDSVYDIIQYTANNIVSVSRDKTIRKWKLDGTQIYSFPTNSINLCLCQITDTYVAIGGTDNIIHLYDLSNNETITEIGELKGHNEQINCLEYINAETLASGSGDKTIKIWNYIKKELVFTMEGHELGVKCLKLLKDGRLASGSFDNTFKIWDLTRFTFDMTFDSDAGHIFCIQQLKDERLIIGTNDWCISIWDYKEYKQDFSIDAHGEAVNTILVTGEYVLTGSSDNKIKIWKINE